MLFPPLGVIPMQVNVGEDLVREQQGHRWPIPPTKLVHHLDSRLGRFIPRFHPGGVLEIHEAVFVGTPDLRLRGQTPDLLQRGEHIAQLPFKDRPAGAGKEGVTGEEVVTGREMVGDMGAGVGVDIEDHALALVDDDLFTWADNAGLHGNTACIAGANHFDVGEMLDQGANAGGMVAMVMGTEDLREPRCMGAKPGEHRLGIARVNAKGLVAPFV